MAGRVERHDAEPAREQRAAEIDEPRTAAPPSVDCQNAGAALSPRPRGDAPAPDGQIKPPSGSQPHGHSFADRPARG
jgi:hypothetical protein